MEKKGEMTADFLKEEEKMRKSGAMEETLREYEEVRRLIEERWRFATDEEKRQIRHWAEHGLQTRLSDSTDPMPIIE